MMVKAHQNLMMCHMPPADMEGGDGYFSVVDMQDNTDLWAFCVMRVASEVSILGTQVSFCRTTVQ